MFEILLLMVSMAAHSVTATSTGSASAAVVPQQAGDGGAVAGQDATAAVENGNSDAPPAFLSPSDEPVLVAEPQVPTGKFTTATEVKPILAATRSAWISVRDFDGKDLLYVTHLWSWRCGLLDMKIGINGATPERWPLPDCHMDQQMPSAILESDGLPFREFPQGSISTVEVEITYDDLSTERVRFDRNGAEMQ